MKWSLKSKLIFWFILIIVIAVVIYGFMLFSVYRFTLAGENYSQALRDHPGMDQELIDRLREMERPPEWRAIPLQVTVLPFTLFMRIFYIITAGVLFIILVSASGGFIVLIRMLNRVDFITRNVQEIDEKRLHLRLNLKDGDAISKMAQTFDHMLDKIEASFRNQKQFIQHVSHELNTPLTIIKSKIDALKQQKKTSVAEYRQTLDLVDSEVMRLSKITEELLILSELEDNIKSTGFKAVDVKEIIDRLIKLHRNQIDAKELDIKLNYGSTYTAWGSNVHIEQLLFNILNNAVKYSLPGSDLMVDLNVDKSKKLLHISVKNKSEEITGEDIPYIFERFYTAARKKGKRGSGLGLSISKRIAEKLNGNLIAEYDEKNKLVSFTITLPIVRQ
ncbi:MAG: HAMP domain-containing histidine kinase [Actinomycetia bacterium]|nr:HAMP domain-containing histidine kinase [Actinomycetes bacterium]